MYDSWRFSYSILFLSAISWFPAFVILLGALIYANMARKMLIGGEPDGLKASEHYDFDLFVIGAGSGGVRAARTSAGFGAKVI